MAKLQPVIAVDIDDVLVPHYELMTEFVNKHHGYALRSHDFQNWEKLLQLTGINREEFVAQVEPFIQSEDFVEQSPAFEVMEALSTLSKYYRIVAVTARPRSIEQRTIKWMAEHFGTSIPEIEFVNPNQAWGRGGSVSKLEVCLRLGAKYLIDDHLKHAQDVAAGGIKVILYGNYPWNQLDALPDNILRARDWGEVLKILLPHAV